jgi:SAM-dependent methyltransferase
MKIIVTGGAGFIASHIVDRCINEGHETFIIDNISTGREKNLNSKAKFYKADITTPEAAEIILKEKPEKHYDIGSILSFSTMLSAFLPVEFYDYRPVEIKLSNLKTKHADLLSLPFKDNSVKSISCLHTLEHVGLGRYGDPLDPDGDLKAIKELIRVLAPGGTLLIAIPIGRPKIEFNAHRIYSYDQIFKYFNSLVLKEFSLIPDNAIETGIISLATKKDSDEQNYGCGCFWFKKNE